jgi:DsbC/DsbD-like thiol-disulfide interchange protein/cytochrome c biogenesis protein CcdA
MPQRLHFRLFLALLFIAVSALSTGANAQFGQKSSAAAGSVVTTPYVRAELLAHAPQGVAPGQPLWLGLQITHQPEWHTYWKNPGDSGLPTELVWTLPAGLDAGEIAWPLPRKIPIGTLANYGYEGTVLLPVPVTVASTFAPGPLAKDATIKLRASWLVCRKECIPEEGEFTLQLPIQSTTALSGAAFDAAAKAQPKPVLAGTNGIVPDSQAQVASDGNTLNVSVQGLPAALRGKALDLFPETGEIIDNAAPWPQAWNGSVWTATVPLSPQRSASPSLMPVVLAEKTSGQETAGHATGPDTRTGYRAELKVLGTWPQGAAVATVSPALEAALKANAAQAGGTAATNAATATPGGGASSLTLTAALLGALLGGLILNLMPCVFPVLAIKVVGFTQHAQNRRAHRISGIAYTAGVVLSFIALGALMLGLRAAGEAIGWGFQLQSPAVVAGLAALFTLIALNLAGVFELGHFLPSSVASLQARHPVADSFLTGVLAVAVASPCTAPFMGASLGLTATLPAPQALAVFAALGLGLALPYLAASFVPAVARALPRPGAWMDTFRKLMAFPMLATVVWLVWVLGQQSGIDGAGALLILLVGEGEGPRFAKVVRNEADVAELAVPDMDKLRYVFDAVTSIRKALNGRVPLIGFSGSPWTLACYVVEGKGSDDYRLVKSLMYSRPDLMHRILAVNADAVAQYLNAQIDAGAQAVMVFDSWGGVLADGAFRSSAWPTRTACWRSSSVPAQTARTFRASSLPRAAPCGFKR